MSNKVNTRRGQLYRKKQDKFILEQKVSEMVIPNYSALKDPFLAGFFNHQKGHLKKTGVLTKKRGLSLKGIKQKCSDPQLIEQAQRLMKHRRARSQDRKRKTQKSFGLLPHIDEATEGREFLKSEGGVRAKKVYRSSKPSVQL